MSDTTIVGMYLVDKQLRTKRRGEPARIISVQPHDIDNDGLRNDIVIQYADGFVRMIPETEYTIHGNWALVAPSMVAIVLRHRNNQR